jgi:drug/metabolite transporter (DMT)-like permease
MPPRAFLLALGALGLWSTLAWLGTSLAHVPALLLVGVAFCAAGCLTLPTCGTWSRSGGTWAVGIAGILGYHLLYFNALRSAPPVEANLLNYLWPLLIVVLAPVVLPDCRLRSHHVLGALISLVGVGLIATHGRFRLPTEALAGYGYAIGAAVVWALYSLLTKRRPTFSTTTVGGFCLVSGVVALVLYWLAPGPQQSMPPLRSMDWGLMILCGVGPLGGAFLCWDAALKCGDVRVIGNLGYITPLVSTLVLVWLGRQPLTLVVGLALGVIILGTLIGSLDSLQALLASSSRDTELSPTGDTPL